MKYVINNQGNEVIVSMFAYNYLQDLFLKGYHAGIIQDMFGRVQVIELPINETILFPPFEMKFSLN